MGRRAPGDDLVLPVISAVIAVCATIGAAATWTALVLTSADIEMDLSQKTRDFAKHGTQTPEMVCEETEQFKKRLNAYFKKQSTGKQASFFTLSTDDCLAMLQSKTPASTVENKAPAP